MPLVAWSVLVYSLALIVSLSVGDAMRVGLCTLALTSAAALAIVGRRTPATVSAVAAAAVLISMTVQQADARCTARLAAARDWSADFETDAAPGDVAHVRVRRDGCMVRATLLISGGAARGGDRATVAGRATAGDRGLFIEDAVVSSATRSDLLLRARAAAGRRIDRIFGNDAPMARALVIADMSAISAVTGRRCYHSSPVVALVVAELVAGRSGNATALHSRSTARWRKSGAR